MKKYLLVLSFVSLLAAGCNKTNSSPITINTNQTYTLADVAQHNNQSSCWTAINGKVYDITSFIPSHPGGVANIIQVCGIDGTQAFDNQHDGQRTPNNTLARYQIGILKQ